MNTVTKTFYTHTQPYDDEFCELWDHDAPQQEVIHYLGYEESIEVEIDKDTGKWRYLSLNGIPLVNPSPWYPGGTDTP